MAFSGTIVAVNDSNGMFAVLLDDGDYAVFELCDSISLEPGDKVQGDLDALGGETLLHVDSRQQFEAFGQSGRCTIERAGAFLY
jgi:hypothetical protein